MSADAVGFYTFMPMFKKDEFMNFTTITSKVVRYINALIITL